MTKKRKSKRGFFNPLKVKDLRRKILLVISIFRFLFIFNNFMEI